MRMRKYFCWIGLCLLGLTASNALAQRSETLLPKTTRGYVSILDVDALREKWEKTQLGALARDPAMQPFVEDLKRQIKDRLSQTGVRLGISWSDLEDVYGGEVCVAVIQPDADPEQHALVMIVDITDHRRQAEELLEKIWQNQRAKGATKRTESMAGVDVTVLSVVDPKVEGERRDVFYAIHADRLAVADHAAEMGALLKRLGGDKSATLEAVPAFAEIMQQGLQAERDGEIRWFVEPFGYAETLRAVSPPSERKQDLIKVLSNQGFREAIGGVGGHVFLAEGKHDILHRTLVYAPPVERKEDDQATTRYRLAARMLDFPNTADLEPHSFIPPTTATFVSLSWEMTKAFEYSRSLVNELIGAKEDQDLFEEVIRSLATDPDGPRVDIEKEIVAHLATRGTVISEPRLPVTTKSEQIIAMVELKNEEPVRKAINRLMESDADAKKHIIGDIIVWEIVPEEPPVEIPELEILNDPFDPDLGVDAKDAEEEAEKKLAVPKNSAITVANGHLIVSNHIEYLKKFLTQPADVKGLGTSTDYAAVLAALKGLGADADAARLFTRTDLAYRTTYELIREGKMPEAETMLGKLLNRILTPEDSDEPREQQIDGSKLPPFEAVAKYLGPAGTYVRTVENGWFASGCLLRRGDVVSQASSSSVEQSADANESTRR